MDISNVGLVKVGDEVGVLIGFIPERFDVRSYLFVANKDVYVAHIHTTVMGKGYLHDLFASLRSRGMTVKVPSPYQRMEKILRHYGARPTVEFDLRMGPCEVWVLLPPEHNDDTLQSNLA